LTALPRLVLFNQYKITTVVLCLAGEGAVQLHLSPNDGVPIYLQIINQVKFLVASGRLRPGEELPPIRALAERLLINPNTVARAYRELEQAGVVVKRSTTGTFVSDAPLALPLEERRRMLTERAEALLAEARQLNLGLEEVIDLLRQRDEAMRPRPEEK
jgi:GntR family transcriptional regulator